MVAFWSLFQLEGRFGSIWSCHCVNWSRHNQNWWPRLVGANQGHRETTYWGGEQNELNYHQRQLRGRSRSTREEVVGPKLAMAGISVGQWLSRLVPRQPLPVTTAAVVGSVCRQCCQCGDAWLDSSPDSSFCAAIAPNKPKLCQHLVQSFDFWF